MPAKVVILAQFDHGYYIRGTLKRLTDVVDWLKARWIRFDHGYYIHGTLKWLARFFAGLKGWWIRLSVKQVTDQKYMSPLPRRRGNAHKSHDFGSVWPWILYPWDFEEVDGCFGLVHGLVDLSGNPCPHCLGGEEMPAKVMILAQFEVGYYIRGSLKRPTDVVDWPKTRWICFDHGYYIRGTLKWLADVFSWLKAWWIRLSVKQVTDQKSMPLLDHWRGNAWKMADGCFGMAQSLMDLYVFAQFKAWWIHTRHLCPRCLGGEEIPTKVMILAQYGHGYYIRGTLKRLTGLLAWPQAW
ncbi:hypothetical protein C8R44DRAFT_746986 [Mycena epipterygia]|nr:hypothetical protein C8R44DRAFT_746986 [Mycena epipterygia]